MLSFAKFKDLGLRIRNIPNNVEQREANRMAAFANRIIFGSLKLKLVINSDMVKPTPVSAAAWDN